MSIRSKILTLTISPQKAPDVFVKMAKLVKDEIPNAHFVIVGSGNQEAEIRKYAEENKFADSLHITGWVDDPMSYVELFDVACLLSRWEGFGFCISFENGDCAVDSRVKEVTTYSKKEALEVFLFNGYLTPCVASKMWKKSLWQKIRCPEGKLFEDQYTTYKLLMLANKIVFDPEVYYYYFKRSGSIGHSSFSKRTYDLLFGIGEQYQVITEAYPETTSTMKVARTVWELVFVNMMICSKYNDKETIGQVQKHARNAFLDVVTCKYLPAVRKAEIALFCFNFSAYRFIYIKYKSKKKIA